jgi:CRISPR/Cas system CSM-associated protein Csm3 (group 7 of RAMP superfamily)
MPRTPGATEKAFQVKWCLNCKTAHEAVSHGQHNYYKCFPSFKLEREICPKCKLFGKPKKESKR